MKAQETTHDPAPFKAPGNGGGVWVGAPKSQKVLVGRHILGFCLTNGHVSTFLCVLFWRPRVPTQNLSRGRRGAGHPSTPHSPRSESKPKKACIRYCPLQLMAWTPHTVETFPAHLVTAVAMYWLRIQSNGQKWQ